MVSKQAILLILAVALLYPYVRLLLDMFGVFRKVKNYGMERCKTIDQLKYCESLHVERDSGLTFLSCEIERDRWNPVMGLLDETVPKQSGTVWLYSLATPTEQPYPLQLVDFTEEFHPLGLSVAKHPLLEDTLLLYIINLRRDSRVIEIFQTNARKPTYLKHIRSIVHEVIKNPNDLYIDTAREPTSDGLYSFYFSNDHGSKGNTIMHTLETLLGLPLGNVAYYNMLLETGRVIAKHISFANGITLSQSKNILFVASSFGNNVLGYQVDNSGQFPQLLFNTTLTIPLEMSVDNLDLEPTTGELFATGHPNALKFLKFVKDHTSTFSPSKVVRIKNPENEYQLETMFSDSGENYGTSSGAVVDYSREVMLISGLYENSVLLCNISIK